MDKGVFPVTLERDSLYSTAYNTAAQRGQRNLEAQLSELEQNV
jgi:hypothetical protein